MGAGEISGGEIGSAGALEKEGSGEGDDRRARGLSWGDARAGGERRLTRGGAGPRWSWGAGVGRCWAKKRKKAGLGWVGGVGLLDHVLG